MENQNDNQYLGQEKVSKLLLKFSIPCILSLLISSLYNIVDQIFVGNSSIGYLGNAATTVVYPITIIAVAFAWCFGDGAAAYLSLCQGRKDTKNSHKAIGNSILVSFIISILFIILGFLFMDKLLYGFGASDVTIPLARSYFKIILMGIPFYMLANTVNSVIRADGSPKFSMATTLLGAILNIILDPIFIFVFDLGIEGAAWATIIGQFASFVLSGIYFWKTKTFKLNRDSFHMNFQVFSNVIKLGVSTFITQMSIVVISLVCNIMLAKYGAVSKYGADIPIATIGICMKVFSIVINIVVGIILGAQPILGFNYGAKKYDRVKEVFKLVFTFSLIIGLVSTVIFELCPELVIKMFGTSDSLYMEFAVKTFRIFLMLVSFTCLIKMISIFFQAVGEPLKAAIVSLSRDIIFFVPLVIILPRFFGVEGPLFAAPVADLLGLIISITLIIFFFKRLNTVGKVSKEKVVIQKSKPGVIITISREHGSNGKYIGELVAKQLHIPYYYKEMTALAAKESGLDQEFISKINSKNDVFHDLYLTTSPVKYAIEAQDKIIRKIAGEGSCVIVGRASDYVLRDYENLVRIFIYANDEYKAKKLQELYGDSLKEAMKNMSKSDKNRASYYQMISGKNWGNYQNYDLLIDASIGPEKTAELIVDYIDKIKK